MLNTAFYNIYFLNFKRHKEPYILLISSLIASFVKQRITKDWKLRYMIILPQLSATTGIVLESRKLQVWESAIFLVQLSLSTLLNLKKYLTSIFQSEIVTYHGLQLACINENNFSLNSSFILYTGGWQGRMAPKWH